MNVSPGLSNATSSMTSNPCRYWSPSTMRTTSHMLLDTLTACAVASPSLRHCTNRNGRRHPHGRIRWGSISGKFLGSLSRCLIDAFPLVCHGHQMVKNAATVDMPANMADAAAATSISSMSKSLVPDTEVA